MESVLKKKELNRIAGEVELDVRTVRKVYLGHPVRARTWQLVSDAAARLGMPAPKEWVAL